MSLGHQNIIKMLSKVMEIRRNIPSEKDEREEFQAFIDSVGSYVGKMTPENLVGILYAIK